MPLALGTFIVPLIVACAMFMENVDATVIVTSLPVLARDLGHDPITLKLAVTAYVIGLGVFIPICGWVADRFGSRTVFRMAIGIFIAGSLLSAASTSLATFVLARFVQGIGGAMMVPVGRIIIFRSVPKSDFIRAVNYLTVPALLGPVVGPPLGGFITTYLHWRLIFFINIPIGLFGIWLANRHIENVREAHPGRLDWTGFVLSAGRAAPFLLRVFLVGRGLVAGRAVGPRDRGVRDLRSGYAAMADLVRRADRRHLPVAPDHEPELARICGYPEPRHRPRDERRERDPADLARPRRDDRGDRAADLAQPAGSRDDRVVGFLAGVSGGRTVLGVLDSGHREAAARFRR